MESVKDGSTEFVNRRRQKSICDQDVGLAEDLASLWHLDGIGH